MRLSGKDSLRFCRAPDPAMLGALLYGPDAATVSTGRRAIVLALSEADDLRVTRIEGSQLRKDPAALDEAVRARGFFPGRRVVLIEGAKDDIAETLGVVLAKAGIEDAFIVVEAGALTAKSSLRRLFEQSRHGVACGLYPDPPDAGELLALLRERGVSAGLTSDAEAVLMARVSDLDRAQVTDITEKLSLYATGRVDPLSEAEVAALLPAAPEAELDGLIEAVAGGRVRDVVALLSRASAGGMSATQVMIATGRHFRQLYAVVAAGADPETAVARLRPPLYGARRASMLRQAASWSGTRVEAVLRLIQETERLLRSPGARPDQALTELCLIRIAMLGARR